MQYKHKLLEPILGVTFGCIIYQEQVMQIFRDLAGYSLGRADIVRRAMSKKKHDVLERERQVFLHGQQGEDGAWEVEGCLRRGVDLATAEELFREIENFASYAFNKSHAACYAIVAYETAYLKCHYPKEYLAALLSSVLGWAGKVAEYTEECRVLAPHVNESDMGFAVTEKGIRFGLLAVKNLGRGVIARLVEEREARGPYTSFYNFCRRMAGKDLNRRAIESLVKCGALDGLGNNRKEMLLAVEHVLEALDSAKRRNIEGQMGFFDNPQAEDGGDPPLTPAEDFSQLDKLTMEKEVTGMYLSGHPMAAFSGHYGKGMYARTDQVLQSAQAGEGEAPLYQDGQRVKMLGIITGVRRKNTRSGQTMAFITLEDMYGAIVALVFPKVLEGCGIFLQEGVIVEAAGRLSFQEEKEPELVCMELSPPPEEGAKPPRPGRQGLYLRIGSQQSPLYRKAMQYLAIFDEGQTEVYLRFVDTGKLVKAPPQYRAFVNQPLLRALEKLLGEENVVYRPPQRGS